MGDPLTIPDALPAVEPLGGSTDKHAFPEKHRQKDTRVSVQRHHDSDEKDTPWDADPSKQLDEEA